MALQNVAGNAELWEKVVRKLQRGAMPPLGVKRPEPAALDGLTAYLEAQLDRAALASPNPGEPLVHRLNRTEYGNAIRDLLGLDLDVSSLLPPDDSAYGFDNIADVLGLSPVLIERYVSVAEGVSALAVGEPDVSLGSSTYLMRQDRSQNVHIDGLPLGTVGGLAVNHIFPLNAEYEFQILLLRTNTDSLIGLERAHQLEVAIDGQRVFLDVIGGERDQPKRPARRERGADDADDDTGPPVEARLKVRVPVPAGRHTVSAAWVQRRGADTNRLQSFVRTTASPYDSTGMPHIRTLTIVGPYNPTGPGDTPSRQRIFVCTPANPKAESAVRAADPLDPGPPRVSAPDRPRRHAAVDGFLRVRPEGGHLRDGHPAGPAAPARQPAVPPSHRTRSGHRRGAAGRRVSPERSRAGVPALVLPLEQHPGR